MSILDIFKSPDPAAVPGTPGQPAQPGTPGSPVAPVTTVIPDPGAPVTEQNPGTPANGLVPTQPITPTEPADNSPLAPFKSLWEDTPTDPNAKPTDEAPLTLNPEDVAKAVEKADFSSAITPENLAAIAAGGEEAQKAFSAALNAVARQTLTQSTLVSNKLAEQMVEKALAKQAAEIPGLLRSQNAATHLVDSNPVFQNPAVKPVIEATQAQLLTKFPEATPAEITKMTNDYILAMGEAFAPKPAVDPAAIDTDWTKFLTGT